MQERKRTFKYGDKFRLAGLEWVVLRTIPAAYPGGNDCHFCEATEDVFQAPFDENNDNDWNKASLRKRLNGEFLEDLIEKCPALKDAIVPTYRDLTADDGLRDYGNCLDNVTMLTAEEYRETRDLHPAPEHWRWLITPDGTPRSSGTAFVRHVDSGGALYRDIAYNGDYGVRPALTLKSDILASILDAEEQREAMEARSCEDSTTLLPGVGETPEQAEMALYEQAVEQFGETAQILMAVEEMSELQKALLKYLRFKDHELGDKPEILAAISEERADVEIMLNQLQVIFGDNSEMEVAKLVHLCELLG
mgnify:CR=1 FL=1